MHSEEKNKRQSITFFKFQFAQWSLMLFMITFLMTMFLNKKIPLKYMLCSSKDWLFELHSMCFRSIQRKSPLWCHVITWPTQMKHQTLSTMQVSFLTSEEIILSSTHLQSPCTLTTEYKLHYKGCWINLSFINRFSETYFASSQVTPQDSVHLSAPI